jgi:formylglycine-generating enzyme required for sulfatase activity
MFAFTASMLAALTPAAEPAQKDLLNAFVSEFVEITPGQKAFPKSFVQGAQKPASEAPAHEVTLAQPFAIAKYEVPQNLYEAVMGTNPSKWKGPRNSVEMMSWNEAVEFCQKLTELLRAEGLIAKDEVIRLPTESEWEYCCRAGTRTAYSFGDRATNATDSGAKASLLDPYGWHNGNAAGNDPPVGALKPNPWGLHDVHGYLWEYCADEWHKDYDGAPANRD